MCNISLFIIHVYIYNSTLYWIHGKIYLIKQSFLLISLTWTSNKLTIANNTWYYLRAYVLRFSSLQLNFEMLYRFWSDMYKWLSNNQVTLLKYLLGPNHGVMVNELSKRKLFSVFRVRLASFFVDWQRHYLGTIPWYLRFEYIYVTIGLCVDAKS